jgi:exopolysaccharide biosynthesis polyprenyl glycosylphosphotransferase
MSFSPRRTGTDHGSADPADDPRQIEGQLEPIDITSQDERRGHLSTAEVHDRSSPSHSTATFELRPHESSATSRASSAFRRFSQGLAVADVCCILTALLIVYIPTVTGSGGRGGVTLVLILAPITWLAVFYSFGLYKGLPLAMPEEFSHLVGATIVGIAAIFVGGSWLNEGWDRSTLGLTWAAALSLELIARATSRWLVRLKGSRGRLSLRTLIVGRLNDEAESIVQALTVPGAFTSVGIVTPPDDDVPLMDLPVLGSIDDLVGIIRRESVECVVVASRTVTPTDVNAVSRACRLTNTHMLVSVNTPPVLLSRLSVRNVQGLSMLAIHPTGLSGPRAGLKRSFDLVAAVVAAVVLSPLMMAIAVMIKLSSPGPVLYRQARVTKGGRSFTMYKFRTMVVAPEGPIDGTVVDLSRPFFKMTDDPRLTRLGNVLRSYSLDELPQLWNVIRGEMSLVGPRPLPIEQVAANLELLGPRHEVRAGLTGWWQVNGRSNNDAESSMQLDRFYVENWSLSLDMRILGKTLAAVLSRRGAY